VGANFAPGMYAYANAKSTTGRHFVLVRTLADQSIGFDTVDKRQAGYTAEIWLVIQPLAYPIVVLPGQCLSQLRVFTGDTRFMHDDLHEHLLTSDILSRRNGIAYKQGELSLESGDGTFFMTISAPRTGFMGYKAKKGKTSMHFSAPIGSVDPSDYFEPVYAGADGTLELEPGEFYLLSTKEIVSVPTHLSAEIRAMDPRLGIFFSHFAGFIDPGFEGTITLEVMAPLGATLRSGDPVARILFERIAGKTDSYSESGNYATQIETGLPKQFGIHPAI
jgi:dCTP deaminase